MSRIGRSVSILLVGLLLTGCVERRFVITSDPPGALVMLNGQPLDGLTPADNHFLYYGNYHFTLYKDGFAPLEIDQPIPTPWYEWIGVDFFSENLWPSWIRDVRHFHYQLLPLQVRRPDEIVNRAQELRDRGKIVAPPLETPPELAPVPSVVPQSPVPELSDVSAR